MKRINIVFAMIVIMVLSLFTVMAYAQDYSSESDVGTETGNIMNEGTMPGSDMGTYGTGEVGTTNVQGTAGINATPLSATGTPLFVASENVDAFMRNWLTSKYPNLTNSSIDTWRQRGYTFAEIGLGANIAAKTGSNFNDVMASVANGQTWNQVAMARGLNVADASNVAPTMLSAESLALSNAYLMRTYNLSQADINSWRAQGISDNDIALAANIAMRSGRSTQSILDMRAQGMTWTDIATNVGLSPTAIATLPTYEPSLTANEESLARASIMRDYGISGADIDSLRARGYTYPQIEAAANIAVRSNRNIIDIANMHDQGMTWEQVASNVGVNTALVAVPYQSSVAAGREVGTPQRRRGTIPKTGK